MEKAPPKISIRKLKFKDSSAAFDHEDLRRTPQQRFEIAEELIKLAFKMRGLDDRVQKHITRIVRRGR